MSERERERGVRERERERERGMFERERGVSQVLLERFDNGDDDCRINENFRN